MPHMPMPDRNLLGDLGLSRSSRLESLPRVARISMPDRRGGPSTPSRKAPDRLTEDGVDLLHGHVLRHGVECLRRVQVPLHRRIEDIGPPLFVGDLLGFRLGAHERCTCSASGPVPPAPRYASTICRNRPRLIDGYQTSLHEASRAALAKVTAGPSIRGHGSGRSRARAVDGGQPWWLT